MGLRPRQSTLALAAGVFCLDWLAKYLAAALPAAGIWLANNVGVQLTANRGLAFGIGGGLMAWLLPLAVTVGVGTWLWRHPAPALAVVFGGALGNTVERLLYGRVTDLIVLGPWPAFNVADAAITLGVAYLVWREIRRKDR